MPSVVYLVLGTTLRYSWPNNTLAGRGSSACRWHACGDLPLSPRSYCWPTRLRHLWPHYFYSSVIPKQRHTSSKQQSFYTDHRWLNNSTIICNLPQSKGAETTSSCRARARAMYVSATTAAEWLVWGTTSYRYQTQLAPGFQSLSHSYPISLRHTCHPPRPASPLPPRSLHQA